MRQKRAKTYKKLMHLYSMTFGFRQPYQVLMDSEICKSAVDHKIELVKQLSNVLQGEVKPMITQCCIHELYLQGKSKQPAVDLAKTFERRKCNHREAIPGDECLAQVVGPSNKHRYIIAAESHPLRVKMRQVPGVPIVHINRTVMVLEPPSDVTIQTKRRMEDSSMQPAGADAALADASKPAEPPKKKKKGPKGPNPLSIKKKKPTEPQAGGKRKRGDEDEEANGTKKRKRKRTKNVDVAEGVHEPADASD